MKYLVGTIVALMLLVPAAMGNIMSQTNWADADGSGTCGIITQNELNAGLSIGANTVLQANEQFATSHDCFNMEQNGVNLAMALGTGNVLIQYNKATANGGQTDQDQLNILAVLGHDNFAVQNNIAVADEARIGDYFENPIFQNQANLGLIVGKSNAMWQTNDAYAQISKDETTDPWIVQNQMNIGVLISATECHDEPEPCPEPEPEPEPVCPCQGWPYCSCD